MREITDREFKETLLNIMVYFDEYCRRNQLQYFLFYGSLIGAVRHKGFIPWDDDIDVIMPREDYERLIKMYDNGGRYKLVTVHNNKKYNLPLAKMIDSDTLLTQEYGRKEFIELGVYVDIFILDGVPEQEKEREKFMEKAIRYKKCWGLASLQFHRPESSWIKDIGRRLFYLPVYIKGQWYYLKKMDILSRTYNYNDSAIVANVFYAESIVEWYYRADFIPVRTDFEGKSFIIPEGYDRCLTTYYGDWRKLPPIKERESNHRYKAYWRNKSNE